MGTLQIVSLVLATVTSGLTAGLFAGFAYAVMPALRRSSAGAYVQVMRAINIVILNPWFMVCYLGCVVFGALALVLHLGADVRGALPWIAIGLALDIATLVITGVVNIPLNNQLESDGRALDQNAGAPGESGPAGEAAARDRFDPRWVRSNVVRTLTSTAAFASFAGALVARG